MAVAGSPEDLRKAIQKWSPGARDTISMIESTTSEESTDAEKQEKINEFAKSIIEDIDKEFVSPFKHLEGSLEMTVLSKLKGEMQAIQDAVKAAGGGGGGGGGGDEGGGGGGGDAPSNGGGGGGGGGQAPSA
jgi:hypothetical protein